MTVFSILYYNNLDITLGHYERLMKYIINYYNQLAKICHYLKCFQNKVEHSRMH